ncbi:beta,beta-carotene 15,15'-dioxygenase [Scleropages formosus]|uniref:Beta-carotene oxygenase 1 n=1 Tax=Scleropages formosus TaxID=113540 RepID=A0A8C9SG81_SCLFO|nr:beta,beta-carotene 15,15'-dioxygenase-like [Scleropages formosus]
MCEKTMQYDYGSNKEEQPCPTKARVNGCIPEWLKGTLVRIGPGMFTVGDTAYNHWFDGMALMHSFAFRGGDVMYRSRYLRGDTYTANMEANRIVVSEMGTMAYPDPSKNIFSKAITFLSHTIPDFTDNCGNNIIRYGEDYYATSETNYIRKIDPETLETQDKVDYQKYLAVNLVTSHPHYDKEGNSYNIGTKIAEKGKTKYTIFKVPPIAKDVPKGTPALKNLEVLCSVPCRSLLTPSYYHSFGMTDNYIIFIEQPLKLDILKMATAYMRHTNWASCLKYNPEDDTLIHLIDRKTQKPVETRYYTDAMVVYHHVNAFEEDGHIVFDIIAYDDNSLYDLFYLNSLRQEINESGSSKKSIPIPKYKRFVLPLQIDKASVGEDLVKLKYTTATAVKEKEKLLLCQPEILCEGLDLPRINYNFNGKKQKYVYLTCSEKPPVPTKVTKFDTETKKMVHWEEQGCWPSEPVFVANPNATEEDDGVVLATVISMDSQKSDFLLVLEAKTFTEIARASVNAQLHMDMHGYFIFQDRVQV